MTAIIGFIGGAQFEVADSYESVMQQLYAGVEWFEVVLADGRYGRIGAKRRLTVNPPAVAYVQEQGNDRL